MLSGLFTKVGRSCAARAVVGKLHHRNQSSVVLSSTRRQHVSLATQRTTSLSLLWRCRSPSLAAFKRLLPANRQSPLFAKNMSYSWKNLPKPNVIFVLGGPGAGKGTQCAKICEEFGFVHLSAGDLLRKEQDTPGSEYGTLIDKHIRNGTIVPVEITCSLLENAMLEHMIKLATTGSAGDEAKDIPAGNFLIDGFPRNQNNLEGWSQQVEGKVNLMFVLYFECPKEECIERCLRRGQTSGRTDDNAASMSKRIDTYLNQTMPIIEIYQNNGLVRCINANRPVEQVFEDVRKLFAQ